MRAALWRASVVSLPERARTRPPLARHILLRGDGRFHMKWGDGAFTSSSVWRERTRRGARSWAEPPRNRPLQTAALAATGLARLLSRSSRRGAFCGPGPRPGAVMSICRTIRPPEQVIAGCDRSVDGGQDVPAVLNACCALRGSRVYQTAFGSATLRTGRIRALCLIQWRSLSGGRGTWFIGPSDTALAAVSFPLGMVGRVLMPQVRA
jgi:hypothetical protein